MQHANFSSAVAVCATSKMLPIDGKAPPGPGTCYLDRGLTGAVVADGTFLVQ